MLSGKHILYCYSLSRANVLNCCEKQFFIFLFYTYCAKILCDELQLVFCPKLYVQ